MVNCRFQLLHTKFFQRTPQPGSSSEKHQSIVDLLWQVVKERKAAERKAAARAGSKGGGGKGGARGEEDAPRRNTGGVSSKKGLVSAPATARGRASLGVKGAGVMKGDFRLSLCAPCHVSRQPLTTPSRDRRLQPA